MIVITTKPDGTLKSHKHETIREQIEENKSVDDKK